MSSRWAWGEKSLLSRLNNIPVSHNKHFEVPPSVEPGFYGRGVSTTSSVSSHYGIRTETANPRTAINDDSCF